MKKDHTVILGLVVFIVLALPVFCVSHDTFAAASAITLTIDDSLVDMNITSTSPNGNFNKSNPSTITVSTTNATGYTLSIAATGGTDSNNPTKLVNTSENTALDSVSSAVTESDFKAANGTSYNNKWGFLPSKYNSLDNTSFLPSPTTVADNNILNQTSTANSTADTFTVSIGARIDHTTKAGSYNNTFVIYATANAIPYTITYDDGIVSNMPTDVAGETDESTVAISDNVPTRTGYTFLGWCTVQPTNNNGTDVCTGGTEYDPGDSLTINPSGSNNFRLYAMWWEPLPLEPTDCPTNSICYAPNASDIVGTMVTGTSTRDLKSIPASATAARQTTLMGDADTAITGNSTPTLVASNYSRVGYGFAGWSTDFTATSSSTIYGPNQTITMATDGTGDADVSEHGLILYPVWIASTGSLQDSSRVATLCGSGSGSLTQATYNSTTGKMEATLTSITALTDQRDGNVYTIAKLADGKCWMTENLRLEAENTIGDTNKNLSQGYGTSTTYGNFTGLANSENANFDETNPPLANSLYSTDGSTTNTIKGGSSFYYRFRFPRYNNNNTNRNLDPSYNGTGSGTYYQWHSYGNYYTWAAAMASVIEYNGPTDQTEGKTSETANTSICPNGWRLPYGNSTGNGATAGGFSYLDTRMGGTGATQTSTAGTAQSKKWRSFPNNFVYSGYFNTASAYTRGTSGFYWSSTTSNNNGSYYLYLHSTYFYSGNGSDFKSYGRSIRCISNN